jgi:hypothetical protein
MRRFPLKAVVPLAGQLVTIVNRSGDALTTLYTLHGRSASGALEIHTCIPHARIVQEITEYARYAVGQLVHIDARWVQFRILARTWNVRQHTVIYSVGDTKRVVRRANFTQAQLLAAEALHAAPDSPPAPQLQGYWDPGCDW